VCNSKTHQTHTFCRVLGLRADWNHGVEHCEVAGCCVGARTGSNVLPTLCCGFVVKTLCLGHCVGGTLWEHSRKHSVLRCFGNKKHAASRCPISTFGVKASRPVATNSEAGMKSRYLASVSRKSCKYLITTSCNNFSSSIRPDAIFGPRTATKVLVWSSRFSFLVCQ